MTPLSIDASLIHAWATQSNRQHHNASTNASLRRLRFAVVFILGVLLFLAGRAFAETDADAPTSKSDAVIDLATKEGGAIVAGGRRIDRPGYFVEPTIITGLTCECRVLQEEIFGPVVTITPFDSEDEAIAFANSTRYGLSATVWTRDLSRAHRVAANLDAGTIWINCWLLRDLRVPFGGMKESGVGREGGFESLNFFTEAKNVCVKI